MTTLEVLLEAERTLMDENEDYNHVYWRSCTCGHIYHAVSGKYSSMAGGMGDQKYQQVLLDILKVLDLEDKVKGIDTPADVISDYVETLALGRSVINGEDYAKVERDHALRVIREAVTAIREQDNEAMLKVIDSHTYSISG